MYLISSVSKDFLYLATAAVYHAAAWALRFGFWLYTYSSKSQPRSFSVVKLTKSDQLPSLDT